MRTSNRSLIGEQLLDCLTCAAQVDADSLCVDVYALFPPSVSIIDMCSKKLRKATTAFGVPKRSRVYSKFSPQVKLKEMLYCVNNCANFRSSSMRHLGFQNANNR